MKHKKIASVIFYYLLAILGGVLIVSLFVGCHVYTDEEVEMIRCPQIQDTVQIPDWEQTEEIRAAKTENLRRSFSFPVAREVGSRICLRPDPASFACR